MNPLKRKEVSPIEFIQCTNQLCKSPDYMAAQVIRRSYLKDGVIVEQVVGTQRQCSKCGELYCAVPGSVYRSPNQFQVRESKPLPDLRHTGEDGPEIEPLPEP